MGFKKDRYRKARGGYSRMLSLHCRVCNHPILHYQKDGPGNLRRLYFDRIFSPKSLTNLSHKSISNIKSLSCPNCKESLGTPYTYKKENRKAFKLYQDALTKKIIKLKD